MDLGPKKDIYRRFIGFLLFPVEMPHQAKAKEFAFQLGSVAISANKANKAKSEKTSRSLPLGVA